MPRPKISSIDDYEEYLSSEVESWSPLQRVAFAAAMCERWLPVYKEFSESENWGDAKLLRAAVDAIWRHAQGQPLQPTQIERYRGQLHDITPHMDDFEAPAALATCVMVSEALQCCRTERNIPSLLQVALSGFYAVEPEWDMDPEEQPRLWRQSVVRLELKQQLELLEAIAALQTFDGTTVQALQRNGAKAYKALKAGLEKVDAQAASTPRSSGLTNQAAFEQYRRMVEADIRNASRQMWGDPSNAYLFSLWVFSPWAARYSRRKNTIDGEYGTIADAPAKAALLARQHSLDAPSSQLPDWNPDVVMVFNMCLQNAPSGIDVRDLVQLHGYGPSLRRLWHEAKARGLADEAAWNSIVEWAYHVPTAWAGEDARKKKGRAATPNLANHFATNVQWHPTDDPLRPWQAAVATQLWQIRINDFPDELMYTLLIDNQEIGDFHDWPETWKR